VAWLEEDPQLTLTAIRDRIQHEMGVVVSQQTVSGRLNHPISRMQSEQCSCISHVGLQPMYLRSVWCVYTRVNG
jgi:hypothetical protein